MMIRIRRLPWYPISTRARRRLCSHSSKASQDHNVDPYAWMQEPNDKILAHLEAENSYCHESMRKTQTLQARIFQEIYKRIDSNQQNNSLLFGKEKELALAEDCDDNYLYYSHRPPNHNFPIYYRREKLTGKEKVLLDQNLFPKYYQRLALGDLKISPDHQLVAFTLTPAESMERGSTLYIRDIQTGVWWTADEDVWTGVGTFEWGLIVGAEEERHQVLYYSKINALGRPCQVWISFIGKKNKEDAVNSGVKPRQALVRQPKQILEIEDQPQFFLSLSHTKDQQYVTVSSNSKTTSEVYLLPGPHATSSFLDVEQPKLFRAKQAHVQYFVDHGESQFFIVTNFSPDDRPRAEYQIMTACSSSAQQMTTQQEWTAHHPLQEQEQEDIDGGGVIEDMDLFQDYLVLYQRWKGQPRLQILDRQEPGAPSHNPPLPPEVTTGRLRPGLNQNYRSCKVRFSVTSPILPDVTYDYDMKRRQLELIHRQVLPGRPPLDPNARYACQRVLVNSKAGSSSSSSSVEIPLTLAFHRDIHPSPSAAKHRPVLLQAYGAYGVSLDLGFRPELVPLLERGWVLAFAHVRGGGELGKQWHDMGRREKKMNSVLDYLDCAQWLIQEHWTQEGLLVGQAASAGALVVARAVHLQPKLFGAMVLKVPFLDLVGNMLDPSLPLTLHEYEEWGDPNQEGTLELLRDLSPYETVPQQQQGSSSGSGCLPPTLIIASLADDRVKYWESAKYVAKLREKAPATEVLLRMERDRGHEAPASQVEAFQEAAFEWAFMVSRLGLAMEEDKYMAEDEGKNRRRRRSTYASSKFDREKRLFLDKVPPLAFWK